MKLSLNSEKALARDADFAAAHYTIGIAYKQLGKNTAAAKHLYEAGLLAFIHGDNTTALNAYRALEEIGPERIVQELHEMLEPLLEDETRGVNRLHNQESIHQGACSKGGETAYTFLRKSCFILVLTSSSTITTSTRKSTGIAKSNKEEVTD